MVGYLIIWAPAVLAIAAVAVIKLRRHYANQPKRPLTLAEELERNRALNAKHKPKPRHEATGANNW